MSVLCLNLIAKIYDNLNVRLYSFALMVFSFPLCNIIIIIIFLSVAFHSLIWFDLILLCRSIPRSWVQIIINLNKIYVFLNKKIPYPLYNRANERFTREFSLSLKLMLNLKDPRIEKECYCCMLCINFCIIKYNNTLHWIYIIGMVK